MASLIYHLFPSTIIAVEPTTSAIFDVQPVDAGRSLDPGDRAGGSRAAGSPERVLEDIALLKAGLVEDYAIGESIQAGFAAGANPWFHFGLFEGTLAHFHRSIDAALAAP